MEAALRRAALRGAALRRIALRREVKVQVVKGWAVRRRERRAEISLLSLGQVAQRWAVKGWDAKE